MSDYQNIRAIYDDSNIKLTMERYGYNLWAFLAFVSMFYVLKITNPTYLYNYAVIFMLMVCLVLYFTYTLK